MASEESRQCVDWLIRCQMLLKDHRMVANGARVQDLANFLKDGVVICNLLNQLNPGTVDPRDFSQRPQMLQFFCRKNINVFLHRCTTVFKIKEDDLFAVDDLANLENVGKVLHTLSVLSRTPLALRTKIEPFSLDGKPLATINNRLSSDDSCEDGNDEDEGYGTSIHSSTTSLGAIAYDDLCSFERTIKRRKAALAAAGLAVAAVARDTTKNASAAAKNAGTAPKDAGTAAKDADTAPEDASTATEDADDFASVQQDMPTKTRRDFCVEEIFETERNYVEALEMIKTKFMKPLQSCPNLLSPKDHEKMFMGFEKLLSIHCEFLERLKESANKKGNSLLTIPDLFVTFKEKFLFYGEFCSNLTGSQELLAKLCQSNAGLLQKIRECQLAANEGKFKLHDLLAIPMQRVLKYHLLISELMKHTEESHPERKSLEHALAEMQDLSLFVNEVRRDHEMLNTIALLAKNISGLPPNTVLKDNGRILMDGEMKVKTQSDNATHTRHLFLFDKRLLICKPSKVGSYIYKTSLLLSTYKLEDTKDKASFQLHEISGNSYLITAKNSDVRNRWKNGILLAQENICPPFAQSREHDFQMATFDRPTICDVCRKFLRGYFFQGYRCQKIKCNMAAHKECLEKAQDMEGPPSALPPRSKERVVAIRCYDGHPAPPSRLVPLKFFVDDRIEVVGSCADAGWSEGELNGKRGYFPRTHVKQLPQRKASLDPNPAGLPANYINMKHSDIDIDTKPWYAGEMSREQAVEILTNSPKGTFIVRKSPEGRKTDHAISIQCDGVKHLKIGVTREGGVEKYALVSARPFSSITDLVEYYREQSLEKLFPDVKVSLFLAYKDVPESVKTQTDSSTDKINGSLGFCVAVYNYSATAPNHISLKRGDRVEILNKVGDERGWWKGSLNGKSGYFPKSYVKE